MQNVNKQLGNGSIIHRHTCEPSGGSIFLPILRVPSVPPVNFQNLLPVKKNHVQ